MHRVRQRENLMPVLENLVYEEAMRVWEHGTSCREEFGTHEEIRNVLDSAVLDAAFDLDIHLRHLDLIFDRMFSEEPG